MSEKVVGILGGMGPGATVNFLAKVSAYCWQEAGDFPQSVRKVFKDSGVELFHDIKLLFAFPEYKVPLPGGR